MSLDINCSGVDDIRTEHDLYLWMTMLDGIIFFIDLDIVLSTVYSFR